MYRLAESQRMRCSIAMNFNGATQKPGMTIDELTSLADVESIISDWEALYERCPDATPFHSPDWLVRWWKHFGFGRLWNRRHVYQSAQRKASRLGSISFESAQLSSCEELIEALVQLNQAGRAKRRLRAALDNPKVQMFHQEVGNAFLRRGWLRMIAMRIGTRIVSVLHGFASGQRSYCYQIGFDPSFQQFSPGTVVQGQVIESAIEEGLSELDFLRGDEPYKYWWGARNRQTYRLALQH